MNEFIKVENVWFDYETEEQQISVLKDFSVSFSKGEFTAVLGHNGCGKSTLAKLLNGLIKPKSGNISVNGMLTSDETKENDIKRTVGMVFQNPDNQIVATVVEEDVAFGLENLGIEVSEMHQRVHKALESVGMLEYRKKSPHQLSGGQKQRVAIAGIVVMEPECIVFDEPTAMLDPSGRKEVMNVISELKSMGITVILITHYMNEAALADRTIVMDKGEIILDDKPQIVFSKYDVLKQAGLDVPQSAQLMYALKKQGVDLPDGIINVNDSVEALTQILLEEK